MSYKIEQPKHQTPKYASRGPQLLGTPQTQCFTSESILDDTMSSKKVVNNTMEEFRKVIKTIPGLIQQDVLIEIIKQTQKTVEEAIKINSEFLQTLNLQQQEELKQANQILQNQRDEILLLRETLRVQCQAPKEVINNNDNKSEFTAQYKSISEEYKNNLELKDVNYKILLQQYESQLIQQRNSFEYQLQALQTILNSQIQENQDLKLCNATLNEKISTLNLMMIQSEQNLGKSRSNSCIRTCVNTNRANSEATSDKFENREEWLQKLDKLHFQEAQQSNRGPIQQNNYMRVQSSPLQPTGQYRNQQQQAYRQQQQQQQNTQIHQSYQYMPRQQTLPDTTQTVQQQQIQTLYEQNIQQQLQFGLSVQQQYEQQCQQQQNMYQQQIPPPSNTQGTILQQPQQHQQQYGNSLQHQYESLSQQSQNIQQPQNVIQQPQTPNGNIVQRYVMRQHIPQYSGHIPQYSGQIVEPTLQIHQLNLK